MDRTDPVWWARRTALKWIRAFAEDDLVAALLAEGGPADRAALIATQKAENAEGLGGRPGVEAAQKAVTIAEIIFDRHVGRPVDGYPRARVVEADRPRPDPVDPRPRRAR